MKMEQTECSETLAYKIQTPENYPQEIIQLTFSQLLNPQKQQGMFWHSAATQPHQSIQLIIHCYWTQKAIRHISMYQAVIHHSLREM